MTKRNKELREIYLLAAEMTATYPGQYACCAISFAVCDLTGEDYITTLHCRARQLFAFLYCPSTSQPGDPYWWPSEHTQEEITTNRTLALLFMAELARTDSLPTLSEIQSA